MNNWLKFFCLLISVAFLIGLTVHVHAPALSGEFLTWDDEKIVRNNQALYDPNLSKLAQRWTEPFYFLYTPVAHTFMHLAALMGGGKPEPVVFHAVSLATHVLTSFALFWLIFLLPFFQSRSVPHIPHCLISLTGALTFAVHPLVVEPVAWISGIEDVLFGLMALLAIFCYSVRCWTLSFSEQIKPGWLTKPWAWLVLCCVFVLLAMLCKPAAAALPLALVCLGFFITVTPGKKLWQSAALKRLLVELLCLLTIVVPVAVYTRMLQSGPPGVDPPELFQRLLVCFDALAFYHWKLFWPLSLGIDHGRLPHMVQWHWMLLWGLPATAAALWLLRRQPYSQACLLASVLMLLPVLGFIPFNFQIYSTVADRFYYGSLLFISLLLANLLCTLYQSRQRLCWLLIVCLQALLIVAGLQLTKPQSATWVSNETLYTQALRVNPQSAMAHNNLAYLRLTQKRFQECIKLGERAIELRPNYPEAYYNIGWALEEMGAPDLAVVYLERGLREAGQDNALALSALGRAYAMLRRLDDAQTVLEKAVQLDPGLTGAQEMLKRVKEVKARQSPQKK